MSIDTVVLYYKCKCGNESKRILTIDEFDELEESTTHSLEMRFVSMRKRNDADGSVLELRLLNAQLQAPSCACNKPAESNTTEVKDNGGYLWLNPL